MMVIVSLGSLRVIQKQYKTSFHFYTDLGYPRLGSYLHKPFSFRIHHFHSFCNHLQKLILSFLGHALTRFFSAVDPVGNEA